MHLFSSFHRRGRLKFLLPHRLLFRRRHDLCFLIGRCPSTLHRCLRALIYFPVKLRQMVACKENPGRCEPGFSAKTVRLRGRRRRPPSQCRIAWEISLAPATMNACPRGLPTFERAEFDALYVHRFAQSDRSLPSPTQGIVSVRPWGSIGGPARLLVRKLIFACISRLWRSLQRAAARCKRASRA